MDDNKQYITKDRQKELKIELEELKTVKRKKVAEHLKYARSLGDLSENAEYNEAREEQAKVEDRINAIENTLKRAEIVRHHHANTVEVGVTVTVQKKGEKEKKEFNIVGTEEADMAKQKLSYTSPLGKAMIGHEKGESFKFTTPKGNVEYKIISIK